jgi:hypothetical protein
MAADIAALEARHAELEAEAADKVCVRVCVCVEGVSVCVCAGASLQVCVCVSACWACTWRPLQTQHTHRALSAAAWHQRGARAGERHCWAAHGEGDPGWRRGQGAQRQGGRARHGVRWLAPTASRLAPGATQPPPPPPHTHTPPPPPPRPGMLQHRQHHALAALATRALAHAA